MFKFVVLSVILAIVAADPAPAPGHLYGGHAYAPLSYPLATSYQNRVDVRSKPIALAYSSPVIGHSGYGYAGLGLGHSSYGYGYGLGGKGLLGYSGLGVGHSYGYGYNLAGQGRLGGLGYGAHSSYHY